MSRGERRRFLLSFNIVRLTRPRICG